MKFLPLRQLEPINRALVFDTADIRVVGGCEMYTTKAAGTDKKLYKTISATLSSRYESDLRLSESLSSRPLESQAVYRTLHSPFGPLDQVSARRTFAYLIATLNASHPDYDFSSVLRPTDFRRERSLKAVINAFNTTLFNLCGAAHVANRGMWDAIDTEMELKRCCVYSYQPEEGDEVDGAIWSMGYFFFNKQKKRVCYLFLRGVRKEGRNRGGIVLEGESEEEEVDGAASVWGGESTWGDFEAEV